MTTASQVSWTTSSAEAWVETNERARRSIDADHASRTAAKVPSSPPRSAATSSVSGGSWLTGRI
ncbi:hypothetical protein [Amycolatopsis sp. Hca4]|uniref:hypothetical protein n=1 Tax=Amycolatopsis sp. Hca4 TaxID=2742131 RepID=UPI0020CB5674|nr:hypothetical protein [Amycolatopsis sp. Hca4]